MADTCGSAGVPMLILFAPIEAGYKDARDFDRLDHWGRELEKMHPGLTVERPIILAYESRLMRDAVHLNLAGVEKFMPVVAKDVQEAVERRWRSQQTRVNRIAASSGLGREMR